MTINDAATKNRRKIPKAVFLLLEKYHRIFGLAVIGWAKPPGNYYFSLHSLAVQDQDGKPRHLPEVDGRYSLTIYQDHVGLPAWGAGDQLEHPECRKRELRSAELLAWYEDRLTLRQFFAAYAKDIAAWRKAYNVSRSEPYLLTWNVMGLVASKTGDYVFDPYRCESYDDSDLPRQREIACVLGVLGSEEGDHSCGGIHFAANGKALLPGRAEPVDLWRRFIEGESPAEIAEWLLATRPG